MTTLNVPIPRQPVPVLDVPLLGGVRFGEILGALGFVATHACPARGEYIGPV